MRQETYSVALPNGKRYDNLTLEEAKEKLFDEAGLSYAYINDLVREVTNRDRPGVDISWVPGRNKNWQIGDVRMGRRAALFALEFKGFSAEEARFLLSAAKLSADARELSERLEKEKLDRLFEWCQQCILSAKDGTEQKKSSSPESTEPSSPKVNTEQSKPRAKQQSRTRSKSQASKQRKACQQTPA